MPKTPRRPRSATARAAAAATKVIRDGRKTRTPKAAPKPPAKPDTTKPTKAEQAAADKKARQEKIRADVKWKLAKLTEMSKTTAEQCGRLVEAWDEAAAKVEDLKPHLGHAKAELQKTKESIRQQARAMKSAGLTKDDLADGGKELASLEQRAEKWELSIAQLTEQRDGHREAAKAAMADLRKLIRDKVAGALLFERDDDQETGTPKGKAGTGKTTSSSTSPSPSGSATASPATRPSSESPPDNANGSKGKPSNGADTTKSASREKFKLATFAEIQADVVAGVRPSWHEHDVWRLRNKFASVTVDGTNAIEAAACTVLGNIADLMKAGKLGDIKGLTAEQFVAVSNAMEQLAGEKAVA